MKIFIFLGAIFCFSGVLAGAVGSHALKDYLIRMEGLNRYLLATDYMFYHGIALIFVAFALDRFPDIPFHRAVGCLSPERSCFRVIFISSA